MRKYREKEPDEWELTQNEKIENWTFNLIKLRHKIELPYHIIHRNIERQRI